MLRSWNIAALALIATLLASTASAAETPPPTPTGPGPKAVVDSPVADLPHVARGEKVVHDFIIRNTGEAPLEISSVRPACGCTVTSFDAVIAPGASGKVHAELDTSGMSGGSSKSIAVFTNDPANPRIDLTLMAKVEDHLVFNPGFARFVQGKGHPPGQITQLFFSPSQPELTVTKVVSPYPFLKAEYREATEKERKNELGGKQYVFTLTLDYELAPIGPLSASVDVYTNHPKQEVGYLKVSGFVRPRLAVTPPIADFGELDLSQPVAAKFLVHNFAAAPIHLTKVEPGIKSFEVSLTAAEDGRKYLVELKLPSDLPKGAFSTEVKIHTDSTAEPVLVIPVKGKVM